MALSRAFQSALAKFYSNYYGSLIFQFGIGCFVLLPALIFLGLIGTGCVILGIIILGPLVILFSPILVSVGIFVGGVTSVTLAAVGITVWLWKSIVRIGKGIVETAKGMYYKVVQWLITELENMDTTYETEPTTPATSPPRPQTPQVSPLTPPVDNDDITPFEHSPTKSEQTDDESSSSQTPEKSCAENSPTDDSFVSPERPAGDGAKEKSLLFKSFLYICAGLAIAQCAVLVFFSYLLRNMEPYASAVLEMTRQ